MPDPVLTVSGLSVGFASEGMTVVAVSDISFSIMPGETLGLVGESGCGKSVTAMSLLRLVPSPPGKTLSGSALFMGEDLLTAPIERLREIRGAGIGVVFQDPMTALSPLRKVGEQVAEAARIHNGISRKEAELLAVEWLEKVGIQDPARRANEYPHQLSGGMQQRVMIAGALLLSPKLIIADEPTTALDASLQAQVLELMLKIKGQDSAMLLITHDMSVVRETCDRVAVMYAGEIVETAPVSELFDRPLHPYTCALLAALPSAATRGKRLSSIPGNVPLPGQYLDGCRFAPRCAYFGKECHGARCDLEEISPGHSVRCFLTFTKQR